MIVENLMEFQPVNLFIRVRNLLRDDVRVYLKSEMFNPGGSVKFKAAVGIIRSLESSGHLAPGGAIIETTSGNMGIALALLARHRGYGFICVSDDKVTAHNRALIQAYGGELVILPGSTLNDRFGYIRDRISHDGSLVWTRQFSNGVNPETHEATTAREILDTFQTVDYLFVGTGTGGTLAGIGGALSAAKRPVRLVAVDAEGSAHFPSQTVGARRRLPGIGASERSPFLDAAILHDIVHVPEHEAIRACRELVYSTGWLLGASAGSVLFAIRKLQQSFRSGDLVVGIAADSGERYLNELYNDEWVSLHFPNLRLGASAERLRRSEVDSRTRAPPWAPEERG
jgi:N-(2-amino-2-carboxyethyl)-L-glutamate synthase